MPTNAVMKLSWGLLGSGKMRMVNEVSYLCLRGNVGARGGGVFKEARPLFLK